MKQNLLSGVLLMCLLAVMTGPTYAANWVDLSGGEALRDFVSGARVEIDLRDAESNESPLLASAEDGLLAQLIEGLLWRKSTLESHFSAAKNDPIRSLD